MDKPFTQPNPVADLYKNLAQNNFVKPVPERQDNVVVDEPLIAGIGKPDCDQTIEEGVDDHDRAFIYSGIDHHTDHEEQHSAIPYVNPDLPENEQIYRYTRDSTPLNHGLHQHHTGNDWANGGNNSFVSNSPHLFGHTKEMFRDVENILDKNKTTDDRHVFTGVHHDIEELFKKHADANGNVPEHITIHHPAFLSTSSKFDIAQEFPKHHKKAEQFDTSQHPLREGSDDSPENVRLNHDGSQSYVRTNVLKIHIPKGTHAITMRQGRDHMKIDENPDDHITLGEKEILLHRGHDIKIHRSPHRLGRTTTWHAEVVGRNPKFSAEEHLNYLNKVIPERSDEA
jgi:hypothetical protein